MPLDHPRNAAEAALLDPAEIAVPDGYPRAAAVSDQAAAAFAASFAAVGQIEPIIVRPNLGGGFLLVAGRRRLEACIAAGIGVAATIRRDLTEAEAMALGIATNTNRAPLAPVDTWRAMTRLQDLGWTLEDAAAALGFGERHARKLAKLGALHPDVLAAIEEHGLPNERDLAHIANADQAKQAAALKAASPPGGGVTWWRVAESLADRRIPQERAIFDIATAGVVFEEDLFAEPGAPYQFTTSDVAGFMAAQRAALDALAAASKGKIEVVELGKNGTIPQPKGFDDFGYWRVGDELKRGQTARAALQPDGNVYGRIFHKVAQPPKAAKRGAAPAAGDADEEEDAPPPPVEKAKPRFTHRGMEMIAEAKTAALRAALRDRQPPAAPRVLRCLLLALSASNVAIRSAHDGFDDIAAVAHAASDETPQGEELLRRAGTEALARILTCGAPIGNYAVSSGAAAEWIGALLDAEACLPRFDTPEILGTASPDALKAMAEAQGIDAKGTGKALRERLAGKLDDVVPMEAQFAAPAPTIGLPVWDADECGKQAGAARCKCGWERGQEGNGCDLDQWRRDIALLGLAPGDLVEDADGEGRVRLAGPAADQAPPPEKPEPVAARGFDCGWKPGEVCAEHGTTRCINQCPRHAAYLDWCAGTEGKTALRRSGVEQAPAQRRAGGRR